MLLCLFQVYLLGFFNLFNGKFSSLSVTSWIHTHRERHIQHGPTDPELRLFCVYFFQLNLSNGKQTSFGG